ncbi:hypothetical protein ACVIM9_004522 [Bradyrhizobium sp. USDA 4520]
MQADAEHQENDTELRQLGCQRLIGNEAGREGTDGHAREQITDQWRNPKALGDGSEDKSEAEARDDGRDQRCVMRHFALSHSIRGGAPRPFEARHSARKL